MSTTLNPVPALAQVAANPILWVFLIIVGIGLLAVFFFLSRFIGLWIQALVSGAKVSLGSLVGMWLRKVNPRTIVLSRIQSKKAGLDISTNQMETHYLARGDVPRVINALIAADRAKIELDWNTACAIDLAGRDILDAVQA
ncbi:MAG: flotillin-like FloA family protein, partial [Planctomycetota bacterium]